MEISKAAATLKTLLPSEKLLRWAVLLGWAVLGGLLVCAGMLRWHLAPVAISEWDSWGWLRPALGWIGGLGFHEEFEREWLYGAFIAFCLKMTGSFAGYIRIQQLLGLGAAVAMWLAWRTWMALLPRHLLLQIAGMAAGLGVIAIYLFSPIALSLELAIRPEAIMAFTAFLQLFCAAAYCRFRWREPRPWLALVFGTLSLPLAYAMFVLKPNWLLAFASTSLPVLIGVFGRSPSLAFRLLTPAAGAALIVLILILPDKLFFTRTTRTRLVLPMTLFTIHADIIRENMAREIASPRTPEKRRQFLEAFLPLLDREMATARAEKIYYKKLGFDPDYLMYRATIFPLLKSRHGMTETDLAAFCRAEFLSAVRNVPQLYALKVSGQMGYFFFPDDGTFFRKRVDLHGIYRYALTTQPRVLEDAVNEPTRRIYDIYHREAEARSQQETSLTVLRSFRDFLKSAKHGVLALEMAFLVTLAACFAVPSLARLRLPGLVALLFFSAPAGNAFTVALVHALDNSRYRGSYGPLLLFALAAFAVFIAAALASAAFIAYRKVRRV